MIFNLIKEALVLILYWYFCCKAEHALNPTLLADQNVYSKVINDGSVGVTVSELVCYVFGLNYAYVSEINKTAKALNFPVENIYCK